MALKVELKAGEKFILGDSVITNDDQRTRLTIEGEAPILREKDVMTMEAADTPCKKIYLVVQLMYLSRDPLKHHEMYFDMVRDVLEAAPSTRPYIAEVNNHILTGSLYKALKATKGLIEYEGTLLDHASRSSGLRVDG
ncbi:flagellar biosynthesis repressor FlbT [Phreatobacter sp. AB_2022a]|uniref:flagellar biosynthesis repressor FlbT n=1 Tax=Phreatobacter sp. AB_2022a TaxID=3003134 RepID=UPI0005701D29|nr:flagellar biosynthesis repressor FlbT [Phreatobacter sp. AB_2022a]MCZ0735561.1 flagellar biosynthesis repressor FlbT [Phreatobacter sp. AB_2022a]CEJ13859.1 flagellum biosynthesis repressor protein FlbT [bacterium YEK0313]